jgi:hypothetical protein
MSALYTQKLRFKIHANYVIVFTQVTKNYSKKHIARYIFMSVMFLPAPPTLSRQCHVHSYSWSVCQCGVHSDHREWILGHESWVTSLFLNSFVIQILLL